MIGLHHHLRNDARKIDEANPRNEALSGSAFPKTGNDEKNELTSRELHHHGELEVLFRQLAGDEHVPGPEVSPRFFCGGHPVRQPNLGVLGGIQQNANGGVPDHLTTNVRRHLRRNLRPRIKSMWLPVPVLEPSRLPRISHRWQDTRRALPIRPSAMPSWRTKSGKLLPTAKALHTTTFIRKTTDFTIRKIWCLKGRKEEILLKEYHWMIELISY